MEESTHQERAVSPSYWSSVLVAGLLFGIIVFALTLLTNYATINAEPTGSYISPPQYIGIFACLLGAFGGMLATWHYSREYDEVVITLGRGALIGFLTGACIVLVTTVLNQLWLLVDPDMTEKMIDSTIANYEAMDIPEQQKQNLIDASVESMRGSQSMLMQFLVGIPLYGILNLLTGMIGAKLFGKQEETL